MAQILQSLPSVDVVTGTTRGAREVISAANIEYLVNPESRGRKFNTTDHTAAVFTLKVDLKASRENPDKPERVTFNKSTQTSVKAAAKKFMEGFAGISGARRSGFREPAAPTDSGIYYIYELKDKSRVALLLIAGAADAATAAQYLQKFDALLGDRKTGSGAVVDLRDVWTLMQTVNKALDTQGNVIPGLEQQVDQAEAQLAVMLGAFPDATRSGASDDDIKMKIRQFERVMSVIEAARRDGDRVQYHGASSSSKSRSKTARPHPLLTLAGWSQRVLESIQLYVSDGKGGLSVKAISNRHYVKLDASGNLVTSMVNKNGHNVPKSIPQSASFTHPFAFPSQDPVANRLLLDRLVQEISTLMPQASEQQASVLGEISAAARKAIVELNTAPSHTGGLITTARSSSPRPRVTL